ncbi:hypothetical protein GGX14DRAFT_559653 [Mycena pura]|uniref:Uncharacterized protein n=1 Tax=Mycena pura TaxID=153505 RepID=A0AAD6VUW8_9AGAR|nr:hypothetical protein GGX14DRAFT_559653 [Mycena pura]
MKTLAGLVPHGPGLVNRTVVHTFQMLSGEPTLVLVTIYISPIYGVIYGRACVPAPRARSVRGLSDNLRREARLHPRAGRADHHRVGAGVNGAATLLGGVGLFGARIRAESPRRVRN